MAAWRDESKNGDWTCVEALDRSAQKKYGTPDALGVPQSCDLI
jgi:hypothetical protein